MKRPEPAHFTHRNDYSTPDGGGSHPNAPDDSRWNENERDETETERLDRNWIQLLQELRVVQTGVQILTGFLLTLPFQQHFSDLTYAEKYIYLATLSFSTLATAVLVAPVAMHRLLFRRHALPRLVRDGHRLSLTGLAFLGGALTGVLALTFDVVVNASAGLIAGTLAAVVVLALWVMCPIYQRRGLRPHESGKADTSEF
ncbi:DUF6328 family protein [Rhodococcus erythropolis]|uniref:Sodium:proton antiporter n=1 Tax=Rhodococcus erythropolis TaxID=1833 RepID=A0A8I1D966_RHOER|nr:DUF6328 family protein [Rhodococcus erythropolis]MBH5144318.1 hypothetical protein [Rhodococcus erythropolis]